MVEEIQIDGNTWINNEYLEENYTNINDPYMQEHWVLDDELNEEWTDVNDLESGHWVMNSELESSWVNLLEEEGRWVHINDLEENYIDLKSDENRFLAKVSIDVTSVVEFGQERYYPISDAAKALLKFCKKNTFTAWQLELLEEAGFEVNITVKPKN